MIKKYSDVIDAVIKLKDSRLPDNLRWLTEEKNVIELNNLIECYSYMTSNPNTSSHYVIVCDQTDDLNSLISVDKLLQNKHSIFISSDGQIAESAGFEEDMRRMERTFTEKNGERITADKEIFSGAFYSYSDGLIVKAKCTFNEPHATLARLGQSDEAYSLIIGGKFLCLLKDVGKTLSPKERQTLSGMLYSCMKSMYIITDFEQTAIFRYPDNSIGITVSESTMSTKAEYDESTYNRICYSVILGLDRALPEDRVSALEKICEKLCQDLKQDTKTYPSDIYYRLEKLYVYDYEDLEGDAI